MIAIKMDMKPLSDALLFMAKEQREFAMRDALNRSMDAMQTTAKRGIGRQANVAIADIAKSMKKLPARGSSLNAEVVVTARWLPASYPLFKFKQDKSLGGGASFVPWKGQKEFVRGGFIASMRSGHTSIFKRGRPLLKRGTTVYAAKRRAWLPIHDTGWGPNVAREMVRDDHGHTLPKEISDRAMWVFEARFVYQYERVVGQAKAKFGL